MNEEALIRAIVAETREEAAEVLEEVKASVSSASPDMKPEEAERLAKSEIGYYAGYFSIETQARVQDLFDCEHPILGRVDQYRDLSGQALLTMGIAFGELVSEGASVDEVSRSSTWAEIRKSIAEGNFDS